VNLTITGLRPGEKLHESLHFPFERLEETGHAGIRRAVGPPSDGTDGLNDLVGDLELAALAHDDQTVRRLLRSVGRLGVNRSVQAVPTRRADDVRVTGHVEAGA
jgi:FlaA1/EpsC-like NDP-sugar epimerase